MIKRTMLALGLAVFISGCGTPPDYVPVETSVKNFTVSATRAEVFDAALVVAQASNLDVAVLEKDSGLIRFEAASISSDQMDVYCLYPFTVSNSDVAWDTYYNWNARSVRAGSGAVRGRVSISILVSEVESECNLSIRSNWECFNNTETHACNSTGILERELLQGIESHLASLSE